MVISMDSASPITLPPATVCEQARLSRDARFDGLFFTAVRSTGIYCRPVCPAPTPKAIHVDYYPSAATAEAAGFRPCLRCRPELSPEAGSWRRGDALLARALALIDDGLLAEQPLTALADRLAVGERHLRRLFKAQLGVPPIAVHGTRRLLFAKQLLTETAMPVTQVAMAAGFNSLRRFNAVFLEAYRMAPRDLRRRERAGSAGDALTLRLDYRPPFDFAATLDFLHGRALPGIERVDALGYTRVIGDASAPGSLHVSAWPGAGSALALRLEGVATDRVLASVQRVRRMFDLDADPETITRTLSTDARLRPLVRQRRGLRLPSGWDGLEIAVRAIIGQQVSVAAARTFTARLVDRFGTVLPVDAPGGFARLFPDAAVLVDADLTTIGLTRRRAETINGLARALLQGSVSFASGQTLEGFVERLTALPGIGPWTAHYMALRALAHPDAFPADDLVLQKALPGDGSRMTAKALTERAQAWRPWRAYAVIHLWRDAMAGAAVPATINKVESGSKSVPSTRPTRARRAQPASRKRTP